MKKIILKTLTFYKTYLSKILFWFFGSNCRFYPTCSDYGKFAIQKFGILRGCVLTLKRLSRCHPFGGAGFDPIPEKT